MPRPRKDSPLPSLYAMVQPGLEEVAAEEIQAELGGEIKRSGRGVVVFRLDEIDERVLRLRTTEDVFLLAWGTDQLTYRAADLDLIERWTAKRGDWEHLLKVHHALTPRPHGKPTFRMVAQMEGKHGYLRKDAGKALARGLEGKFPGSWKPAEENAAVEFWLTIHGKMAVCGLRLSDRTMRHRTYKVEHRPASLRPTVAAAMVRLAECRPTDVVLDPMCGAGTILAELLLAQRARAGHIPVWGGDIEMEAARAAAANLRRLAPLWVGSQEPPRGRGVVLARWDAARLPLPPASVDRVLCNPPFGKQLGDPRTLDLLYQRLVRECDRVLKPGGRAVLLVGEAARLRRAVQTVGWSALRHVGVRVLGQPAVITLWRKDS